MWREFCTVDPEKNPDEVGSGDGTKERLGEISGDRRPVTFWKEECVGGTHRHTDTPLHKGRYSRIEGQRFGPTQRLYNSPSLPLLPLLHPPSLPLYPKGAFQDDRGPHNKSHPLHPPQSFCWRLCHKRTKLLRCSIRNCSRFRCRTLPIPCLVPIIPCDDGTIWQAIRPFLPRNLP